jgi:hypothetical protein
MPDAPFWSDDFDMDLPKVIPDARDLLGDLADLELTTEGGSTKGRLNHPCVWNGDRTMLSWFGFGAPYRPSQMITGRQEALITCTAWEAFRDAWPHGYLIQVMQRPVWDTFPLQYHFDVIMGDLRGWQPRPSGAKRSREVVGRSIVQAVKRLRAVAEHYGKAERR